MSRRAVPVALLLDDLALFIAVSNMAFLAGDYRMAARHVVATLFVIAIPGWAALRLGGAPPSILTLVAAVVLSISAAQLTGMVVVEAFNWSWRPAAIVWTAGSIAALAICLFREFRRDAQSEAGSAW